MNVMNAKIEPTIEHGGSCKTYFMVPKEAMRAQTDGSYLEYVSEFEIAVELFVVLVGHRYLFVSGFEVRKLVIVVVILILELFCFDALQVSFVRRGSDDDI